MRNMFLLAMVGLVAQLVDGSLGMACGATWWSFIFGYGQLRGNPQHIISLR